MRTFVVTTAGIVGLSSVAWAADWARHANVQEITMSAAYLEESDTTSNVIVRPDAIVHPDGGGLEADPDIGMPAMNADSPDGAAATSRQ